MLECIQRGDYMILFASGRCDIPAFYSEWFFNRMKEGFVDVRNPFNEHQISRIPLNAYDVDMVAFCTKNPLPMLPRLAEMKDIPYVFHITITPYHHDIESHVVDKKQVIEAVKKLVKEIGSTRVFVRYDPILFTPKYTVAYHATAFERLCQELYGYVDQYIISYVDEYKNTKANMAKMKLLPMQDIWVRESAKAIGVIAQANKVHVQTCAEAYNLQEYGIYNEPCFSNESMSKLLGRPYQGTPGASVRKECSCLPTVDIGDYNCCAHGCGYCYANYDEQQVLQRMKLHDPTSSVLIGHLDEQDLIKERKEKSHRQLNLF